MSKLNELIPGQGAERVKEQVLLLERTWVPSTHVRWFQKELTLMTFVGSEPLLT